jgi:2',3'-cyclic-nucleotide 2'-phosphodiesterase (5'-nucleotidase family)
MTDMFNRWIAVLLLAVSFGYCYADNSGSARLLMPDKTIVILYENDVHCAIDGYTKLAGLRDAIAASDSKGNWIVRNGETNLGDLCADAFRERCKADIGLVNGGAIRNNIPAGKITLGDAINALPFYDMVCKIEATGEVILNMLRQSTKNYPQEDGSFPQVAGMKYTINVNTHAITDVQVMNRETSQYEPLQADRKYTIGVCDYYNSGGFYGTLKDVTLVEQFNELINIALAKYIKDTLQGDVSAYRNPKQRIHITSI